MFNIRGKKTLNGRIGRFGKAGAPLAFYAFFLVLGALSFVIRLKLTTNG